MILNDLIDKTGVDVLAHLDRQVEVPVLRGMQRQGDIIVIPASVGESGGTSVPAEGVPVVRGENGGNTHLLLADGAVSWKVASGQLIGRLTVAEGSAAYLAHPEHGYMGIAPGSYTIHRQREQADEIRIVAD